MNCFLWNFEGAFEFFSLHRLKAGIPEDSFHSKPYAQESKEKGDQGKIKNGPQFLAAAIASLTGFIMGEMVSWSSPVTPLLIKSQTITKAEESWIVSILNFGAILGCLLAGYVNKFMGRKTVLLIICIPDMVSWLMLAFCEGAMLLCIGRFVMGLCLGFICVTTPLYISEIAHASVRGALATLFQLFITIGILYTFILGALDNALQITLGCSVPVIVFFCLFIWMPETPVYLLMVEKQKEAVASLQWLRGRDAEIYTEQQAMEESVNEARQTKPSYAVFFQDIGTFKALIIALGLFFFQQMSGINAVIFYLTTVFETAGSTIPPTLATILIGIVQVLATGMSVYLMDKAGRRFLFIFSLAACCACLIVLGGYFFLRSHHYDVSSVGWLPVASVAAYLVLFAMGLGPTPWAMIGEIFNKNISSLAMSIATAGHWTLAFIVTKAYSTCEAVLGTGPTFWMFAAWNIVGIVFCCILLPETKGRAVEDIVNELRGKKKSEIPTSVPA